MKSSLGKMKYRLVFFLAMLVIMILAAGLLFSGSGKSTDTVSETGSASGGKNNVTLLK